MGPNPERTDASISPDDPFAYGPNAWLIEEKFRQFQEFPESVGESWRDFLSGQEPRPSVPPIPAQETPESDEEPLAEVEVEVEDETSAPEGNGRATPPQTPPTNGAPTIASAATPPAAPVPSAGPAPPPATEPPRTSLPQSETQPIRGVLARIVENMERSLEIPTATSVRDLPVRLLEENRRLINQVLEGSTHRKISYTHIIAWAIVKALGRHPSLTSSYVEIEGTPHRVVPNHINFGLAVDVEKKDGTRTLLVPNIKAADTLDFESFFDAYNAVLEKVRKNKVEPDDFAGTTVTLTNPGMIGTVHSIPRLMQGQGLIVATGSIAYPSEFRSTDPRTIARLGISKIMTVTSTYDHRVIQGAESGQFLQRLDSLLSGEEAFYEEIFASLAIPYEPVGSVRDLNPYLDGFSGLVDKEAKVLQLINMYRVRGHLIANLNPLAEGVPAHAELDPDTYGLSVWDYDREFLTGGLAGKDRLTLREILEELRESYCQTIGVEYMHIQEPIQKQWIRDRVEGSRRSDWLDAKQKRRILGKLNAAEAFEKFLHTKYVGHKRFSLEGAETLIPILDTLFTKATEIGIAESVIGMAHRGRLNVLVNVLDRPLEKTFREFEGDIDPQSLDGSGDVKYHIGAMGCHTIEDGRSIDLTLSSNPSHLEAVDPVVEGMARAKQDARGADRGSVLPVLIHGDAAFAGQGIVAETLNLSDLKGYRTGGTVHVVVNNGIGFTTAPVDARSTVYPTDVARMVQAPIFHVNGNDPEACVHVIELALAFRQEFQKDVVVDMLCYRKHGHNEGDEPMFTQPIMYRAIEKMRPVRLLYAETLVHRGDIEPAEADEAVRDFRAKLESAFEATHDSRPPTPILPKDPMMDDARPSVATGVPLETLQSVLHKISSFPESHHVHPKLVKQLEARGRMLGEDSVDWATGEALAFGTLALEGTNIRLSGQDSRRGTFSQRHSVLIDQDTGAEYAPLAELTEDQGRFAAFDSLLSEFAVMGFEYGYSASDPKGLVLWEAQFGDFVNGAQVIIDQFLSSSYEKWKQGCGLVLLLPHGFEGQGPEHSSARIERFLTLCAMKNMRVVVPTNAAQYFHVLRRQVHQPPHKPLIVMTPKSLLRAPSAKSHTDEFVDGKFHLILDDLDVRDPGATKLLFCCGKVAYDLMTFRAEHRIEGVGIIRFEQLYPFPSDDLAEIVRRYPRATEVRWVQEEPMNMGAWHYIQAKLLDRLPSTHRLSFAGRPPSGSPATGSQSMHAVEQEYLVQQAFFT